MILACIYNCIQGGIQVNILERNGSLAHQLTGGEWVGGDDST